MRVGGGLWGLTVLACSSGCFHSCCSVLLVEWKARVSRCDISCCLRLTALLLLLLFPQRFQDCQANISLDSQAGGEGMSTHSSMQCVKRSCTSICCSGRAGRRFGLSLKDLNSALGALDLAGLGGD
jgi:hypothetical protein